MAFTDPQSITITGFNGGSAISLPRTSDSPNRSEYTSNDGLYKVTVSVLTSGKPGSASYRVRSMFRVDVSILATDPFNAAVSAYQTYSAWVVTDKPPFGFTVTQMTNITSALLGLLTASTNAAIVKMLGGEH
jgi:hypothetical protein